MNTVEISESMVSGQGHPSSSFETEKLLYKQAVIEAFAQHKMSPIMHKVPLQLRNLNVNAYEPHVVSIGPYHHDKGHLKAMQDIKKSFFDTNAKKISENLRAAIRKEEDRIKKCYVETNGLIPEQFVDMVVIDGFFIVQLFRGFVPTDLLLRGYDHNETVYDLLLVENQLPFFVLVKIHQIITKNEGTAEEFTELALKFFGDDLIGDAKRSRGSRIRNQNVPHLLGLIHDSPRWVPSIGTEQVEKESGYQSKKAKCGWKFIPWGRQLDETGKSFDGESGTDPEVAGTSTQGGDKEKYILGNESRSKQAKCGWKFIPWARSEPEETRKRDILGNEDRSKKAKCGWKLFKACARSEPERTRKKAKRKGLFIRCATELEEAGISFEGRDEEEEKCRALDIEFKLVNCRKSKLRIPKIRVDDRTELVLRNLIAYEQVFLFGEPNYVMDYVKFLDHLIHTERDVQLLCNSNIIENWLGNYEAVARVINRLRDSTFRSSNFYYSGIFEQVNHHCENCWNKQMSSLQRNYFHSPWALLSFLAALLLILLTIAQTTFALFTSHCRRCELLLIVLSVLLFITGLFSCLRFG